MLKGTFKKISKWIGTALKICGVKLTKETISKEKNTLIGISEKTLKTLTSERKKYNYVLIKAYCATLLASAARSMEALRFFYTDVNIEEVRPPGFVEFLFRSRKHSPPQKIIPIWGFYPLMEDQVTAYLDAVEKRERENRYKFTEKLEIKERSTGKLLFKGPPFFRDFDGRPLTYDKAKVLLEWMLKLENLKHIQFRDFRSKAALLAYKRGWHMEDIRDLLGHKYVKQTRRFLDKIPDIVLLRKERKVRHNLADIPTEYDLN